MPRVLYVSYDGLCEPLGRNQVIPYVVGLSRKGWEMTLLSFEKKTATAAQRRQVRSLLDAAGVSWLPLRYHKAPTTTATSFDICAGAARAAISSLRGRFDIVHARSYVAALIALILKRTTGARFVFDIRGFWIDEKLASGDWHAGALATHARRVEQTLYASADHIISLTQAARDEIRTWPHVREEQEISVIPTCVDLAKYARSANAQRPTQLTLGYVGSITGRYRLAEMIHIFSSIRQREPTAQLRVFTHAASDPIRKACSKFAVPSAAVSISPVAPDEMPQAYSTLHALLCLYTPGHAAIATSPTKLGEALASGCPVIVNPGVGDAAPLVRKSRVGVVTTLDAADHPASADELLSLLAEDPVSLRARCTKAAARHFDMRRAVETLEGIYDKLLATDGRPS